MGGRGSRRPRKWRGGSFRFHCTGTGVLEQRFIPWCWCRSWCAIFPCSDECKRPPVPALGNKKKQPRLHAKLSSWFLYYRVTTMLGISFECDLARHGFCSIKLASTCFLKGCWFYVINFGRTRNRSLTNLSLPIGFVLLAPVAKTWKEKKKILKKCQPHVSLGSSF